MLDELLDHHDVTPMISEMIYSFGLQTNHLEKAYSDSPWVQRRE